MQALMDAARIFLRTAREEVENGLAANDYVRVRDGAEKAWNAVIQATNHAMAARVRVPVPGRDAHRDRRDFLESIGRGDLTEKYTFFAERLHGDVFYAGATLPVTTLRRYLDEVRDYLDRLAAL